MSEKHDMNKTSTEFRELASIMLMVYLTLV